MLKSVAAFALVLLMGAPVFADGMDVSRPRYRYHQLYLPPERHVIEVVRPPYSANFIINGARFVGRTPACWSWAAGERIKLLAGGLERTLRLRSLLQLLSAQHLRDVVRRQPLVTSRAFSGKVDVWFSAENATTQRNPERVSANDRAT